MKVASKLIIFSLLSPLASAQTLIPIQNPSFEQGATVNDYNFGPVPSWPCSGNYFGLWQPLSRGYFATVPDGQTILFLDHATCSQDTGQPPQPNRIYTLRASTGHRKDGYDAQYTMALNAGTTPLCSQTSSNSAIPLGGWEVHGLDCPIGAVAPTGNLVAVLTDLNGQASFDNVTLSYVSTTPSTFQAFKFNAHLRFCNLCDHSDDLTTGLSVLQGTVLQIYQGMASAASFTADGAGDISGALPIDVSQDPLVFNIVMLSPAGSVLCPGMLPGGIQPQPQGTCFQTTISLATLGKWGLVNGVNMFTPDFTSVGLILRLDAKTGTKRGVEQWVAP